LATDLLVMLSDDSEANPADYTVEYSSSNAAVASVAADGTVTGVSSGSANISAAVTYGEDTKTAILSVKVPAIKDAYSAISYSVSEDWGGGLGKHSWGVNSTKHNSWMAFYQVDFGEEAGYGLLYSASLAVDAAHSGGTVELREGSVTGPLLGSVVIEDSGGWGTIGKNTAEIPVLTGIHDLFVVFQGNSSSNGNFFGIGFEALVDEEPPTAPELTVTESTYASVSLEWTLSTDNIQLDGYEVAYKRSDAEEWEAYSYDGGEPSEEVASLKDTVIGLDANTSYDFKIIARDAAGNAAESNIVNVVTERYADVPATHPAYEAIVALAEMDAFVDADLTFRPDEMMSEGAFVSAIVRVLDLQGDRSTPPFYDPADYGIYAADIERAYESGLIIGRFSADEELTEVQMRNLLQKAARLAGMDAEPARFENPQMSVTRAEAAQALYNLIRIEE
jgi:hypothetical protein